MTIQTTFHARVAGDAISKVSRLFNASLDDIFAELFQNARRAGATKVSVSQIDYPDFGPVICIIDDGPGLNDPKDLFTLGHSAWDEHTQSLEDAAGMGFFALAGRRVRIIAQQAGTSRSWVIDATPDGFAGVDPITYVDGPANHDGTTILIATKAGENFVSAANHAAQYLPLEVMVDGVIAERKDFLADAGHIEEWNGIRIGVYERGPIGFRNHETVNFHGVTLYGKLPSVSQEFHRSYYARLDVLNCAQLKLVLPARKEIVENAFLDALRKHIRQLFYRLIAMAGPHSLPYRAFLDASEHGVDLPPAMMTLRVFQPSHADSDQTCFGKVENVSDDDIVYASDGGAIEEQNLAYALSHQRTETRLYDPKSVFEGYEWYDDLARLTVDHYRVVGDTETNCVKPAERFTLAERPDALEIHCTLAGKGDQTRCTENWSCATDWLIFGEDDWGLDEVDIAVTKTSKATSADLVDFLQASLFNPSDDCEAGSYDQQQEWFRDEAEDIAINLLNSELEARRQAVIRVVDRHLDWLPKTDDPVTITIQNGRTQVSGLV
jgi:hypothetical protein